MKYVNIVVIGKFTSFLILQIINLYKISDRLWLNLPLHFLINDLNSNIHGYR